LGGEGGLLEGSKKGKEKSLEPWGEIKRLECSRTVAIEKK